AGGEGSVRGFGYDDLSPVAAVTLPNGTRKYLKIGGRDVLTGSIEVVRDVTRRIGIAVFSDAGNAFDSLGRSGNPVYPHFIEYSAGIGLRWRLPVLTLGIDVAQPLSRPGAGPHFDVYFGPKL
ncbi:MAG: BamA/TamA family outer membrane protein, partial [Steroidobacteraceae bacterium]